MYDYPIPNAAPYDPSQFWTNAAEINRDLRRGGLNDLVQGGFTLLFSEIKLEDLLSGLADSTRSYRTDWLGRGWFSFVRGISVWLEPGTPGWDEPPLDFLIRTIEIIGRKSSTLKSRFAAVRFMRFVNGNVDFSTQAHRTKALIKGLKKREGVRRKQPFNTDFLRWAHRALVGEPSQRINGTGAMYFELFTACILGFLILLRISENRCPQAGRHLDRRKEWEELHLYSGPGIKGKHL